MKKKLTIKEIAQRANVSVSTVSRVINNSGYVGKKARKSVESAIADLEYKPDSRARGLRGISPRIVALVIPDILNVYYTTLSEEIEKNLRQKGYTMMLGVTNDDSDLFLEYLNKFWDIQVDGLIYVPPPEEDSSPFVRGLISSGFPMVELNRRREVDLLDGVEADNFGAVCQAIEHLISLNHKKIAFIVGSQKTTTGKGRLEGYRCSLNKVGLEVHPELIKIGTFSRAYGEKATRELLEIEGSLKPTAIFSTSNRLLMGTMTVLGERGIRVPEDLSVIAFDDTEWLEFWSPAITTVDIAIDKMAELTVDLLRNRIENEDSSENPRTYTLSTVLKNRNSCKTIEKVQLL
ncbi:MAG TPA: LacI family transcriptional regulator [Anaerolineae bacterium]|nr:LacI family transcriptional regulator [Anaerolineae bacterium]